MNLLVTGGAGYIGGTVASLLSAQGHAVTVLDDLGHSRREAVPAGARFVQGELGDRALLENLFTSATAQNHPFHAVLHFAALIEAGESMRQPERFFRNNSAATLTLLEAMLAAGPRTLVFSSTAAVYGEPEQIPIPETARLQPTNAYGESKLLVEQMLAWFHRIHGFRYASLRYFNVAGAPEGPQGITRGEAHDPETHLIPLILDVALGRRDSIRIYGDDYPTPDGTCIRDYIHVSDLADAHILALQALQSESSQPAAGKSEPGQSEPGQSATDYPGPLIYNLGNGKGFSVREVIESARRVTGHPIPAQVLPRRPGDPAFLVASSEKAMLELGWQPRYTRLDEILRTAWVWHQMRYRA
ncbi:MAG TPA: UDP-glucose 4-epimerase GalE [Terracidiphilus sp.]|nr:UDP-glucose 4-epimerase GalE [Terracidiphilus sp.]